MLPNTENLDDLILDFEDDVPQNTQTFAINMTENTMGATIDDLKALSQNIYLMLNIEADQYIIYPYTYGFNTLDLIGKPSYYIAAVIPGRIKETLLSDNRITDVSDFEFIVSKNQMTVKFVVHTIYGNLEEETVVSY